jgi:AcrR family transcriptional regulator
MTTPARILRALADDHETDRPPMTEKQRARHLRILTLSQALFAEVGSRNITFTNLAIALRIGSATLRWHFADLDALLAAIIRRHLAAISKALSHIPRNDPQREQKCRAAYLAFTRNEDGTLTEAHRLLVHETHHLPDDERIRIERIAEVLANRLAGTMGAEAKTLLDCASFNAGAIETALAALKPASAPAQPEAQIIRLPPPRAAAPSPIRHLWPDAQMRQARAGP